MGSWGAELSKVWARMETMCHGWRAPVRRRRDGGDPWTGAGPDRGRDCRTWVRSWAAFGLLISGILVAAAAPEPHADSLATGFRSPPAEARPWVYWFWMDGNVSREGITADLEAMRRVGIGGMVMMEVDVGVPRGPVGFMSPEWRILFGHAVREAERLGLEITLNAGPGWTGSGGPWVRPGQSMQHLVASVREVTGPMEFEGELPRPQPREPHSLVHVPLLLGVKEARDGFYAEVAVLAFPTPVAGPGIPEVDEKALFYRLPYSSHPGSARVVPFPGRAPARSGRNRDSGGRGGGPLGSTDGGRSAGVVGAARAMDGAAIGADDHRGQHPARPRAGHRVGIARTVTNQVGTT